MKKNIFYVLTLVALAVFAPRADALVYNFNTSNELGAWSGDPASSYGTVEIVKGVNDWVYFTVTANATFFGPDDKLIWDKFYFNYDGLLDTSKFVVDSSGLKKWSVDTDQNVSMFGVFDYGETGNKPNKSSGNPLQFHIEIAGLDLADFVIANGDGWFFSGHLRGFDALDNLQDAPVTSTFLAVGPATDVTPVPEPGTLVLLGLGLVGLAWLKRYSKAR